MFYFNNKPQNKNIIIQFLFVFFKIISNYFHIFLIIIISSSYFYYNFQLLLLYFLFIFLSNIRISNLVFEILPLFGYLFNRNKIFLKEIFYLFFIYNSKKCYLIKN